MAFDAHAAPCRFPTTSHCSCEVPSFTLRLPSPPPEDVPALTAEREAEIRRSVPSWSTGWRATVDADDEWHVRAESGSLVATVPDYGADFALFIEGARLAVPQLLDEVGRLRVLRVQDESAAKFERESFETYLAEVATPALVDARRARVPGGRRQVARPLARGRQAPARAARRPRGGDSPRPGSPRRGRRHPQAVRPPPPRHRPDRRPEQHVNLPDIPNRVDSFDFHGERAAIYGDARGHWVFPNQLCMFMGIDGNAQRQNIERKHWSQGWTCEIHVQLPGDLQSRTHFLLHERRLPMWLGSITTSRIKDAGVRGRVEDHQTEFADALADYLTDGVAINPRMRDAVASGPSTLTWEHAAWVARSQHGLNVSPADFKDLLTRGGILTTTGRPHKSWERLFWANPSATRFEIHASVLPMLVAFATQFRHDLLMAGRNLQLSLPFPLPEIRREIDGGEAS